LAGELKAWLRCLLRCEQIDQGRKGRRRLVLMEKYAHWQEARGQAPEPCRGRVEELLAGLSDGEQQLVLRSYVEGWTHQELAVEACSTPKAIESKLARLRKRLRENWTHET
jgi:DNA-directed RNA polymerase specialized sigma24 family protein